MARAPWGNMCHAWRHCLSCFACALLCFALLASAFLSIALLYLGVEVGLSMLPNAWWSSPFIVLGGNKVVGVCGAPPCPGLGPCGIGQLHPVHPCFIAQLLCAVLLRSQDRNRLRTPGKHHLIIHHHPSSSIIIGNMWRARRGVTCGTPALG